MLGSRRWDLKQLIGPSLITGPSAAEEEIFEFFENLSTTTASTTWSATTATTLSPETSGRTRFFPKQEWSIASLDVKETLIKDCRFENAKNCLLKYVYGDQWNATTKNCSETAANDIVTTTVHFPVFSESRMISTVLPKSHNAVTTVPPENYTAIVTVLATNHGANETKTSFTTLPFIILPILVPIFVKFTLCCFQQWRTYNPNKGHNSLKLNIRNPIIE